MAEKEPFKRSFNAACNQASSIVLQELSRDITDEMLNSADVSSRRTD